MKYPKIKSHLTWALAVATLVHGTAGHAGLFDLLAKATDKSTQAAAANSAAQYDPNGNAAAQAETLVRKTNPERMKGAKKIVIGQFEVQFLERVEASSTTSNVLNGNPDDAASAYASLVMKGHDRADFQKITDDLYARLKVDLVAAGFELAPLESLATPRDVNGLTRFYDATSKTRPLELEGDGGKSVVYAPTDFPLYHVREGLITQMFGTQRNQFFKEPEDLYTPNPKFGDGMPAAAHLSSLLYFQPAHVLFARYVVSPGSTKGENNKYGDGSLSDALGQTLTAQASITPHLVVAHNQTRFIVSSSNDTGSRFSLIQPVWSSETLGAVAKTTDPSKKTSETVGNVAFAALSALNRIGGGSMASKSVSSDEFTLITTSQTYKPQAIKYLDGVQKMLVQSMQQAAQ